MNTKKLYESKKEEFYSILEDNSLSAEEKIEKLRLIELVENLELHQAELLAQNVELQKIERELIHSQEELHDIFKFAPIAYFKLDKKYNILNYNDAAFRLLSKKNNHFRLAKHFNIYIYKEDLHNYITLINRLLGGEVRVSDTLRYLKDDDMIYGKTLIQKFIKNNTLYFLVAIEDITNEIHNEALLLKQAKDAAMGEMLSMITHQWKNPLTAISLLNSSLQYDIEDDKFEKDKSLEKLSQIQTQIDYLSDTVEDFKNFFRDIKTRQVLTVTNCIKRAIEMTKGSLKAHDIELRIDLEGIEPYRVYGFHNDICQVLINIINNAKDELKKSPHKEKYIQIETQQQKNSLIISLKNNGGMISEESLPRIFEKNFTTKSTQEGTGLGLYISKRIVTDHLDGELWAENTKDNQGVIFYLKVPLLDESKGQL